MLLGSWLKQACWHSWQCTDSKQTPTTMSATNPLGGSTSFTGSPLAKTRWVKPIRPRPEDRPKGVLEPLRGGRPLVKFRKVKKSGRSSALPLSHSGCAAPLRVCPRLPLSPPFIFISPLICSFVSISLSLIS